jgi:hypothetical protein
MIKLFGSGLMAPSDSDKGFYEKLEDKYYDFLDWLNEKGLPVYSVVDFIESKNVPSFPVFLIFLALLLIGFFVLVSGAVAGNGELSVSVVDEQGSPVAAAVVFGKFNGEEVSGKTDSKGVVLLSVPRGLNVEVSASKQGYKLDKPETIKLENEKGSVSVKLVREIKTVSKVISVFEAGTQRAFGDSVQVQFSCVENKDFSSTEVVRNGIVEVDVPDNCGQLNAKVLGDYVLANETIYLSDNDLKMEIGKGSLAKGSVLVTVANNKGETIAGIDVRLYSRASNGTQGALIEEKSTSTNGTASFSDVPVGNYYVVAFDRQGNYGEYDGLKQNVVQEVKANSTTTIAVVMNDSVAGKIKLVVQDKETRELIKGAVVSLSKGQNVITSKQTDEAGKVEFSVGEDVQYNINVDKAGYLIASMKMNPSNDFVTVQIEQATIENSQSLFVVVTDEKDKPIENVRLKLKKNSDGAQVGSELVTGLDGRATFERVEEENYYVYAVKPGYGEKTSDTIRVNNRQQNILKIKIPLGSGKINFGVFDEQGSPVVGAMVKAVDASSFEVLDETTTDSDGKKEIIVRADKKVFLSVSASGFSDYVTIPIQMQKDVSIEKRVVLFKSVSAFGIEPDGLYAGNEKVSESDSALSPGQKYTAKFRLFVPKNSVFDEVEVHIRTGKDTSTSMEKDVAYITDIRGAYNSILKGTTYNPPVGQATDLQHLTSGNAKWGNALFKSIKGGVYEIEADVQVRDEAKIGSSGEIWYRAAGKSSGFVRAPVDSMLGTSGSTSQKQGLYANSLKMSFSIGPSSLCSEDFCASYSIEDLREGIASNVAESYNAQIESSYKLNFEISTISKTPFGSTQISVKDKTAGLVMNSYDVKTALGEQKQGRLNGSELKLSVGELSYGSVIFGTIEFTTKKEGTLPVELSIVSSVSGSNASEIYKKTIFIKVQPARQMNIDVLPKIIVPLINNNLLVKVSNTDGTGIPNAKVSIRKNDEVVASGDTDFEGVFSYTLSSPSEGSSIIISAEKTGYKQAQLEMKSSSNIIVTEPKTIKLNINIDDSEPKNFEGKILNITQIPLQIEKINFSKSLEGYVQIKLFEPNLPASIQPDSNILMSGNLSLVATSSNITQPTRVVGSAIITASNDAFGQKWVAQIPIEINIGFGDEVDDTGCFMIAPVANLKNPIEWKISGTPSETSQFAVTLVNNCKSGSKKVNLRNISARVVSGNQNIFGSFTAGTDNGFESKIDGVFRKVFDVLEKDSDQVITFKFKPDNIISGTANARIELQASNFTQTGEQKLLQKINVNISINNINECIETLTDRDIVVQSCPYNIGFGLYGNRFSQYSNSRYGAFDPMTSRYGYGTGQPPYLGTPSTPNTYGDLGMYGYSNAYYPNSYFGAPFYSGMASYSPNAMMAWSCGTGGFRIRNSCQAPIEISFDAQPGITVKDKMITIEPGKESDVIVEPSNFFGRYALDIKARQANSSQKTNKIKTVYVNVTNPWSKNYRDCISIDPARTIAFNNYFGLPVTLKVINTCYAEGVYLEESTSTIFFPGLAIANPADTGFGYQVGQYPNYNPINGQPYRVANESNLTANQSAGSARELIESYTFLGPEYLTQPNGKVTQVLSFEIVKALKKYRNNAPKAELFGPNIFKDIGNLRYFLTSGYYAIQARTSLIVKFINPFGMQQQIAFPIIVQDLWNALEYAERLNEQFETFGSPAKKPSECINHQALDFTRLGNMPTDRTYYTKDNGGLFIIDEEKGCGTADYLHDFSPQEMVFRQKNWLVMKIQPDPTDPKHNLAISFDTSKWNKTGTTINEDIIAKVSRTITASSELVRLNVKFNIKEIIDDKKEDRKPPEEYMITICENGGETGEAAFEKYGLEKIKYDWRKDEIKEDTCDVGKGNIFCDAVQATISITKKIDKIKEVAGKITTTDSKFGECVKNATNFKCEDPANKTAENLFRYVLKQNEKGIFTNENDEAIEIMKLKQEGLEELLQKKPNTDKQHNLTILNETIKVLKEANTKISNEDMNGLAIYLEVKNLSSGVNFNDLFENAFSIGGSNKIWYAPLTSYIKTHEQIVNCINNNNNNTQNNTQNCNTISISDNNQINIDDLKKALQNIVDNGKLKIVAINQKEMSKKVKEMVMKKGIVSSNYGIKNFFEFYKENIEPKMYLMKDSYDNEFKEKFKEQYYEINLTFNTSNDKNVDAGDYNVSIGKYKWENKADYNAEVYLKIDRTMQKIDEDNKTSFSKNVLFEIPIDGKVEWGTSFSGDGVNNIYLNNFDKDNYQIKNYKQRGNAGTTINRTYEATKNGKLMTISKDLISASLSNPIMIEVTITKQAEEPAGVFYEFKHNGNSEPFQLKYIEKNSKNLADSKDGPFYGYELCDKGNTDESTNDKKYYGLLFTDNEPFNKTFSALAYVPAQVVQEDTGSVISVKCIKEGTILTKEINKINNIIGRADGRGDVSLNNDEMKAYKRTQYNLQNLLNMVKDEKVCIKVEDQKMELLWNTEYFTKKME